MTKDDAVQQAMTSIQSSMQQAIGVAFDAGSNSVDQSGNGKQFAQSDIDAAVAKVTSDDQSHMQTLQSQIDADSSTMTALKASMKDALAQALSLLSPGPDSSATQQSVPASSAASIPTAPAQTAGPAPDGNDGTQSPPAVSNTSPAIATDPSLAAVSPTPAATAPGAPSAPSVLVSSTPQVPTASQTSGS